MGRIEMQDLGVRPDLLQQIRVAPGNDPVMVGNQGQKRDRAGAPLFGATHGQRRLGRVALGSRGRLRLSFLLGGRLASAIAALLAPR